MRYSMLNPVVSKYDLTQSSSEMCMKVRNLPSLRSQPPLLILELLLAGLPCCSSFLRQNRFDANLEGGTDGSVIGGTDLVASVFELLDAADAAIQDAVAPGGRTLLLARIVLITTNVVFIGWRKGDRSFDEAAESEAWILSSRRQKLVTLKEFGKVVLSDGVDDHVTRDGINTVVKITVQEANFMVHDH